MESGDSQQDSHGFGKPPSIVPPGWETADLQQGFRPVSAAGRWVVVEKPAGMLSVPGKGPERADCLAARIARAYPAATGPLIVHRLDMETSGLMVFGLDPEMQRLLSREFEERRVEKQYLALLGRPRNDATSPGRAPVDEGEINLPLRADIERRPLQIVDPVQGKPSITRYVVLKREGEFVRVRFDPVTGRTHQLRVHAAVGLRWPIVGDVLYGGISAARLMLHASRLAFNDPASGQRVEFSSQAPF